MHSQLQEALFAYRARRNFNPQAYLNAKSALLNLHFQQSGIKACIVGISGDLESALAAAILVHASRHLESPLEKIVPLLLSTHAEGAAHQGTATARGVEVCQALGLAPIKVDLNSTLNAARQVSWADMNAKSSSRITDQLLGYLRSSIMSYNAALLSEEGFPCVVCGATNRDKGSYIGFSSKANDGLVDLQPISDLHKSEVYKLAVLLGIPESVLTATPIGGIYDGICDEEIIGTSYDFLELYEWWLCDENRDLWLKSLDAEAQKEFQDNGKMIEDLHRRNMYNYIGDSSAVHLDLLERAVPGGWRRQYRSDSQAPSREFALKPRVGPVDLPETLMRHMDSKNSMSAHAAPIIDFGDSAILLSHAISPEFCSGIVSESKRWTWVEADQHGRPIHTDTNSSLVTMGSFQATAFDESFANRLWKRVSAVLPEFRSISAFTPTDHHGYPAWKPIGINPLLRFIRYDKGGHCLPHYDSGFDIENKRYCTLMSVIILLSESGDGGIRFLVDKQRNLPLNQRNLDDWSIVAKTKDILFSPTLARGDALIFDHKILHEVPEWHGASPHIILQTDVVFERCASHAISWNSFPSSVVESNMDVTDGDLTGYHYDALNEFIPFLPEVQTAPLAKLFSRIPPANVSSSLAVLITTGGMCPLHKGHINMMNEAKKALEKSGVVVLAGFIVPDHDSYVLGKCGNEAMSIAHRIYLAEQAIVDSDWIMIDHWAGFYGPSGIDFMPIIYRMKAQLAAQVPIARSIEVVYVCGGDKAGFSWRFVKEGAIVVVSRPGSSFNMERIKRHREIRNNPRITFVDGATNPGASSKIRKGDFTELPGHVVETYRKIREGDRMAIQPQSHFAETTEEVNFYMRHEGVWAVSHWAERFGVGVENYLPAYNIFCDKIVKLFENAFKEARKVTGGPKVNVIPLYLSDQQKVFQKTVEITHKHDLVISLDPCLPSAHNIAISRCFEILDTSNDCDFVARPGSEPLEKQIDRVVAAIKSRKPRQKVVLFEGDSLTGDTLSKAKSLIQFKDSERAIDQSIALCNSSTILGTSSTEQRPCLGLVDCRDFLVGAREGGLVVRMPYVNGSQLGEKLCRVPCILPYARPAYRAYIPIDQELTFSRQVWRLNKEFMDEVGLPLDAVEGWLDHINHS